MQLLPVLQVLTKSSALLLLFLLLLQLQVLPLCCQKGHGSLLTELP
jgi:hypothetical protein